MVSLSYIGKRRGEDIPLLIHTCHHRNSRLSLKQRFLQIIIAGLLFIFLAAKIIPHFTHSSTASSPLEAQNNEKRLLSNRLLDLANFRWHRNNPLLCSSRHNHILPVLVHTSRNHFLEREAIRRTWGSLTNYKNFSVRPVFLIGEAGVAVATKPADVLLREERKLDEEHRHNGDVITGSFVDSYRNLTYKHMMGYKWILDYCPQAPLVLKTDDDMFLDVTHFMDTFLHDSSNSTSSDRPGGGVDMYCYEFLETKPFREPASKWYVSWADYPDEFYPNYCSGWGYGISVNWMRKLYAMTAVTRYYWVDDAFTGTLLQMAKLAYRELPRVTRIYGWYTKDDKDYKELCSKLGGARRRTGKGKKKKELLRAEKRKFGAVVWVARGGGFARDMECLWRKTLIDKNLL